MVIREKRSIRFKYDVNIGRKLRDKVNEKINFIIKKECKTGDASYDAWNRICVCMDRIDDTVDYLNLIELGKCKSTRAAFDFYEYINCCSLLIECIESLCKIFKVNKVDYIYEGNKNFKSKGTDSDYFKYIRSLAVVHPVKTNKYHSFIPDNAIFQCSPFVTWVSPLISPLKKEQYDLDLAVYSSNNGDKTDWIHLRIDEFDEYITAWINVISDIIIAIDNYNDDYIQKYKSIKIKQRGDFTDIIDYINYLKEETRNRYSDDNDYIFDEYIHIFSIPLSSSKNEYKLEKYRNAIEYSLEFYSNSLQNMIDKGFENTGIKYPNPNVDTSLFFELEYCSNQYGELKKHSYELDKSYRLGPNYPYSYFEKKIARDLIISVKDSLSKYVYISGDESDLELLVLVYLARYLECLDYKTIINRNIPNDMKYREHLIPSDELKELYSDIKLSNEPIVIVELDGEEIEIPSIDE